MKKIGTLLCLASISFSAVSQLKYKAKAGLNISRVERVGTSNNSYLRGYEQSDKFGFYAGGAVEYQLKKTISLQAELLYSLKGLKGVQRSPYYPEYKHGFDFHYLELPLLMRFGLSNNFRIGAGPSIACLVKGKETTEKHYAFDLKHTFTRFDFGLNGDLSYAFRRFEISARYNHGLRTVDQKWDRDAEISGSGEKIPIGKNRTVQIGVAYAFRE